jgi:alcohol dehydrogenase class IV
VNPEAFRFGAGTLGDLPDVLAVLGVARPLVVTTRRGAETAAASVGAVVYAGVRRHAPVETVAEAAARAAEAEVDAILGLGGGSAIDTAKAVSVETGLPLVAIPTTYAGAEWTPFFGLRDDATRTKRGGSGAELAGVVYDPELTLTLPHGETAGTAMNALAHAAEAFYVNGTTDRARRHAFTGARAIAYALPLVLERPDSLYARSRLLEGAMRAGRALGEAGLALGHALAQALGVRYDLAHGALNAVVLPAALRFNAPVVPDAVEDFAEAMGSDDAVAKVEELARLGGYARLRDLGVPGDELDEVGRLAAARPGARANPRTVTPEQAAELLRSVW